MSITYRQTKGTALTYAELDGNFQSITGSINDVSKSYATTGSNAFTGSQIFNGNVTINGSLTATSSLAIQALNANQSYTTYNTLASASSAHYILSISGYGTTQVYYLGNVIYYPTTQELTVTSSYAFTSSYATLASSSLTASFVALAKSSSYSLSSSYALTASYAINAGGINTSSFSSTGSNQFNGTQTITGSLNINGNDGKGNLIQIANLSSSINNVIPTVIFNGAATASIAPGVNNVPAFSLYYQGISGSFHTTASSAYSYVGSPTVLSVTLKVPSPIILSPSGSLSSYSLYVYVNSNWYVLSNQNIAILSTTGVTINTTGFFEVDLIAAGFISSGTPLFDTTTITYPLYSPLTTINSPLSIYPTSSGIPSFTGSDGQFMFGNSGSAQLMYVWLAGRWRSSSLL